MVHVRFGIINVVLFLFLLLLPPPLRYTTEGKVGGVNTKLTLFALEIKDHHHFRIYLTNREF